MKLQLIILPNPIIVSDEEIKEGDKILLKDRRIETCSNAYYDRSSIWFREGSLETMPKYCQKIIAQSHQIDWNGLEAKFEYVDVGKLIKEKVYQKLKITQEGNPAFEKAFPMWWGMFWTMMDTDYKNAILETFQELNNKKFSLEDMRRMYDLSCGQIGLDLLSDQSKNNERFNQFIQELSQPKIFDIEVEMKMKGVGCEAYRCNHPLDPEEWNCDSEECENECKMLTLVPKVTEGKLKIIKKS